MLKVFFKEELFIEKEMTVHSSILAWEILWTEEPGGLQSVGSQRVRHNSATKHNCSNEDSVQPKINKELFKEILLMIKL